MEVIRFALGFRFDNSENLPEPDFTNRCISMLLDSAAAPLFAGMKLYAGRYMLDENDDPEILTVVTMGQGLKRTKALYRELKSNRLFMSMLSPRRPIVQSNVIFHMEDLAHYCDFDDSGNVVPGETGFTRMEPAKPSVPTSELTVVLAPDKFKGSFDQKQVVTILKNAARKALPGCRIIECPTADGGEGTVNVISALLNGRKRKVTVTGPDWEKLEAEYCFIESDTAVIEMAQASGLQVLRGKPDPTDTTSTGTGELIIDALNHGAKKILIGIGGSATNDAGMGAAIALGARFMDQADNEYEGIGANLKYIRKIDVSGLDPRLKDVEITVLSDVTNPLTGENGATMVYGPQKGASQEQLAQLEHGMKNIENRYNAIAGREICSEQGAGAAGGMGAMLMTLLNAKLVSGAETILSIMNFDKLIRGADIVVAGEGMFDETSVKNGKAAGRVVEHARNAGAIPVVIAGCLGEGYECVGNDVLVFSTVTGKQGRLMETDAERLERTAEFAFNGIRTTAMKLVKRTRQRS